MPERTVNPQDSVDLVLLLQSFGDTLGTLYPRAHVYDNNDSEITGSPFALTHVANNLYTKSNAFQVADSGTYKVVYLIYTNAGYTTRSANHGEISDVINVKIQSTTGLGGYGSMKNGGDVFVDMDPIFKAIKDLDKKFNKKLETLKKEYSKGFKIDMPKIPETDLSRVYGAISDVKQAIQGKAVIKPDDFRQFADKYNRNFEKMISAIKKNRSTTIKSKFDKALLKPIFSAVGETDLKLEEKIKQFRVDNAKMLDRTVSNILKNTNRSLEISLNQLDESVRTKLKFTIDALKTLLYSGKQPKQNINITLKKNEE